MQRDNEIYFEIPTLKRSEMKFSENSKSRLKFHLNLVSSRFFVEVSHLVAQRSDAKSSKFYFNVNDVLNYKIETYFLSLIINLFYCEVF